MQAVRFIAVGVVSNLVYFGVLAVCQYLVGTALWVGAALAYLLSAVFNYLAHRSFTFRSGAGHLVALPRYCVVQGTALALNSGALEVLVSRGGYSYVWVQVLALAIVTAWTYAAQRAWVFSSRVTLPRTAHCRRAGHDTSDDVGST